MNFEDLKNPELQERLKAAKTPEELLEIAREEGYELSDDELGAVAGGSDWCSIVCGIVKCTDDDCDDYCNDHAWMA